MTIKKNYRTSHLSREGVDVGVALQIIHGVFHMTRRGCMQRGSMREDDEMPRSAEERIVGRKRDTVGQKHGSGAVSYTHLTLPTICSV